MSPVARVLLAVVLLAASLAFIYFARGVMVTALLAGVIAYALHPHVSWLERHRVPRPAGIVLILLILIAGLSLTVAIALPELGDQLDHFAAEWPKYVAAVREWIAPFAQFVEGRYPEQMEELRVRMQEGARGLLPSVVRALGTALKGAATGVAGLVSWLVNAIMVPVLAYFLLADPESLVAVARRIIPSRTLTRMVPYLSEVNLVLRAWLRGQLSVALALAAIYSVGLTLLGVPLAIPIGVLGGLANMIPYMGLVVGILPAVLLALLDTGGWVTPLLAVGVFGLGQMLEGAVITPRIMGSALNLPSAVVLVAVLAGGQVFGVIGLLLAVPATAALLVVLSTLKSSPAAAPAGDRPGFPLRRRRPR